MHAIILFSHGSVLCGAGETLRRLAERLRVENAAPIIEIGYLNYSEPSFETAVQQCMAAGATRITVAPYFLVAGKFVQGDLPPKIAWSKQQFPEVSIVVADAMRDHPALADAIVNCAVRSAPPEEWRRLLNTAPQFCQDNPQCPLFGTPQCPATAKESTP